jgi:hypothetical protein
MEGERVDDRERACAHVGGAVVIPAASQRGGPGLIPEGKGGGQSLHVLLLFSPRSGENMI